MEKGFIRIRLDFHKAYDKMEWNFISAVLRAFGFSQKFTKLIHQCMSTVNYTLLLNGGKQTRISPSRGLGQGDPLSPYLFVIGSEVLARLINGEDNRGSIKEVKVYNVAPPITKLFYADNVMLFCNAKMSEVRALMNFLLLYCEWSGQSISLEKIGVFSSKGDHSQFLWQIKDQTGIKKLSQGTKYLGVPLFLSNNRSRDFEYVKNKVQARTASWKSKSLSWSGRAILIKLVAQAIPNYTMSRFMFPQTLNGKSDAAVRRFWWSPKKDNQNFYSPLAWDEYASH